MEEKKTIRMLHFSLLCVNQMVLQCRNAILVLVKPAKLNIFWTLEASIFSHFLSFSNITVLVINYGYMD